MEDLRLEDPREIGPYRLVGRIGTGGMGVVYLAATPNDQHVALKLVRADLASDPAFRPRFRREALAVQRVSGICTARYLDADVEAPQPYLVTEYVEGGNLAEYVAHHGPLHGDQLVGLAVGLAQAIAAIHASGVVHRDLKPSNVLMSPFGPKVVDFGISHAVDGTALTQTGVVIGSPSWMAPEQAQGRAVTPAVDVFVWGLTVAYAATGHPPFGEGGPDALYRVVHEEPDLTGLDDRLRPAVVAAMAKDPLARPSAEDLLVRVVKSAMGGQLLDDADTMATVALDRTWKLEPPTKSKRRSFRKIAWVMAATIAIAGLAAGALYVRHEPTSGNTAASDTTSTPSRPVATTTSVAVTTTAPTPTTTRFTGFDYGAAALKLRELGYEPSSNNPAVLAKERGPLYVMTGSCSESAGGYCQHAFFFYGDTYLGTDTSRNDIGVSVLWTTPDVAALSYPLYTPHDHPCCPSGGTRIVRFVWNGSRVLPLNPLPSDPNSTTGSNSGNSDNS